MAEQFFEMLWDCGQCSTHGLLGKAQRHCPMCGAAQDPAKRYFPEEGKEVEVMGHQFVGADWRCTYCDAPNSAAAAFCVGCGGPKDGAREVALVQDATSASSPIMGSQPPATPAAPVAPAANTRAGGFPWVKAVIALFLVVASVVAYLFFSTHDETAQVAEKSWSREIDVEQFTAVRTSEWCDALPSGAYQVSRSREQRSTRQVADGQDCRDVRSDKGDGTFSKTRECSTRYRDEPVYDDKCSFRINRWQVVRTARAQGGAQLAPAWPTPVISSNLVASNTLGAERLGSRREHYRVQLQSKNDKQWTCDLPPNQWETLSQGTPVVLKVRGTGGADCSTLGIAR
jgi:hypothetical protein